MLSVVTLEGTKMDMAVATSEVRGIGPRIRMMLPELTARESLIAQYLLNQGEAVRSLTISDVAQAYEVSEAMIVKLAKRLGFSGYRQLREGLYRYSQLPVAEMFQEIDPGDSTAEIIGKIFQTSIQALEETLTVLDVPNVDRAVTAIINAKQRELYGVGGSAAIAKDVGHKFIRIGIRMNAYEDAHLMMMSASLLKPGDVVIGISHSGQTTAVLEPARLAKQNGATIIALTNHAMSKLGKEADIVLCSTAQGSPLLGENAAARVAQLNIIDALFACVAQRQQKESWSNLDKTMSSVQDKRE